MKAMPLDIGTLTVLGRLKDAGYGANVVGGAVRNHLLGIPVTDIDITTSALPEQTKAVFSDLRVIETGIKHGTVTVLFDGAPYEITTYRTDGEYLDNRHPSSVAFTSDLREDLSRRDFTVNALCYNPTDGYTDLFGGIEDIKKRIIRAVGEPERRFGEDALRILRAIRFASVLGFTIEENTAIAVHNSCSLLKNVSRERILSEWEKLLGGRSAYEIISQYNDVISVAIPELDVISLPDRERFLAADVKTRQLAIFYLSTPTPVQSFDTAMTSLHSDNMTRKVGISALSLVQSIRPLGISDIAEAIYLHGQAAVRQAVKLGILVGEYSAEIENTVDAILASDLPTSLAGLAVSGRDLLDLGISGPSIGRLLDLLIKAVLRGECRNTKDELTAYLMNILKKAD